VYEQCEGRSEQAVEFCEHGETFGHNTWYSLGHDGSGRTP